MGSNRAVIVWDNPIIGPLAYLGYRFDTIENLHRYPDKMYSDFDINRFAYYLGRGVWPYLIKLLVGIVVGIPSGILVTIGFYGGLFGAAATAQGGDNEALAATVFILSFGLSFFVAVSILILAHLFVFPVCLRAGLAQDFGEGFNFRWVRDFMRRTWWDLVMMTMFIVMSGFVMFFIGAAMLCIGVYYTNTMVIFAHSHLTYQLYEIYLARGGEPIPLKEPPPMDAPLVADAV